MHGALAAVAIVALGLVPRLRAEESIESAETEVPTTPYPLSVEGPKPAPITPPTTAEIDAAIKALPNHSTVVINAALDDAATRLLDLWQMEASMKTYGEAVADVMAFHAEAEASLADLEQYEARAEQLERRRVDALDQHALDDPPARRPDCRTDGDLVRSSCTAGEQ